MDKQQDIKTSYYQIAGYMLKIKGNQLVPLLEEIPGFSVFAATDLSCQEYIVEEEPDMQDVSFVPLYDIVFEDILFQFGRWDNEYRVRMHDQKNTEIFLMRYVRTSFSVSVTPTSNPMIFRFALWMAYGMLILPSKSVAIHTSAICHDGQAVLFLGESGTGKSTHTRLWRENIPGSSLINDDSPIVRVQEDGRVMVYGSPWSGKTPCYRQVSYPLKAIVRLSQAPCNHIRKLSVLESIGALLPSCPPALAADKDCAAMLYQFLSAVLSVVPVYALACLPDKAAAELSFSTVFNRNE